MSVVSRPKRQKSWQIAREIVSLAGTLEAERESFGERLRAWARAAGLESDEDAARKIGVSYRQYQRWLAGESEPRGRSLKLVSAGLGVPMAELVGEADKSQLDRIEDTLKEIAARLSGADGLADRPTPDVGGVADRLLEEGESPRSEESEPEQSGPAG